MKSLRPTTLTSVTTMLLTLLLGIQPATAAPGDKLTTPPPTLTNPQTIDLTNTTSTITLAKNKDYILQLPKTTWNNPNGLTVTGGRNIIIIGGTVNVGEGTTCPKADYSCPPTLMMKRAAYFKDQTGTIHLEGVKFYSNTGTLTEGINISAPQAKAIIQNIKIASTITGTDATNHGDCLQTWNGPHSLRIDGFTCITAYQGILLHPHDVWNGAKLTKDWQLKNVSIQGTSTAKHLLLKYRSLPFNIPTQNVYTFGGLGNYRGSIDWPTVTRTRPPIDLTSTAGSNYQTPGYL